MLSRLVLLLLRRRNAVVVGRPARLSRDRISCCKTSDGGSDGSSSPRYRGGLFGKGRDDDADRDQEDAGQNVGVQGVAEEDRAEAQRHGGVECDRK